MPAKGNQKTPKTGKAEKEKGPARPGKAAQSSSGDLAAEVKRLARLDEKVDSVWNRLADFEERMEGEGTRHGHDADDFDEAPEKDYYER